jgi:peptidoglycan hydrolase CwlO-like protein
MANKNYYYEFHESHVNYLQNKLDSEYKEYIEGTGNKSPDTDEEIYQIYHEIQSHREKIDLLKK